MIRQQWVKDNSDRIFVSSAFEDESLFEEYLDLLKKHKFVHAEIGTDIDGDMYSEEMGYVMEDLERSKPHLYSMWNWSKYDEYFFNEQSFLELAIDLRDANIELKEFHPNLEILRTIKFFIDDTHEKNVKEYISKELDIESSDISTEDPNQMQYITQSLQIDPYRNFMFALNSYESLKLDEELFVNTAKISFDKAREIENTESFLREVA